MPWHWWALLHSSAWHCQFIAFLSEVLFYAHLRLVAKMKFGPFCTNSVNGILCQKARQEGKNPQHSHLSVHLAGSTSLSHYFAGGFFGSLNPTWYPAQRYQLKVSEEDLAPALLINGILKYVPLSVGFSKMIKSCWVIKLKLCKQAEESWQLTEKEWYDQATFLNCWNSLFFG